MGSPPGSWLAAVPARMADLTLDLHTYNSLFDLIASSGLTLQICLIMARSLRCKFWRSGFVKGEVLIAWSIALRMHELYTRPQVLCERWRDKRTGSSFLNFFHAVFTHVIVASTHPPAQRACPPGSRRTLTTSSLSCQT